MDAGIFSELGKKLFTQPDDDGQVMFGPDGQIDVPMSKDSGGGANVLGPSIADSGASMDFWQTFVPQEGDTTASATYYPVMLPPTTQISPSMATPLPGLFTDTFQATFLPTADSTTTSTSLTTISSLKPVTPSPSVTGSLASSITTSSASAVLSSQLSSVPLSSSWSQSSSGFSSSLPSSFHSFISPSQIATVTPFNSRTISTPPLLSSSFTSTTSSLSSSSLSRSSRTSLSAIKSKSISSKPSTATAISSTSAPLSSSAILSATSVASSETAIPPLIPARASNLNVHNPTFYIGIALGTIAALACVAALIAWCFRIRTRVKRKRAANTIVPWATLSNDEDGGLEAGRISSQDVAARGAMNLGSLEELAHVQAWSPRGDRDVGEPRRASEYVHGSMYSLQDHPIPGYGLFSEESLTSSFDAHSTAPLHHRNTLRQLPSHLVDAQLSAEAQRSGVSLNACPVRTGAGSFSHNPYLVRRDTAAGGRFSKPYGDRWTAPWNHQAESSHRSITERLRNLGKPPPEPIWDRLPTPGGGDPKEEAEPWAASFKSSLVNAFNAVAAGISSSAAVPKLEEDDLLTAPPVRKNRASVRDTFEKPLSRGPSASIKSDAWTLEEKGDGTGVVHFIPSVEMQARGSDASQRPSMHASTLSFGDDESISTYDESSAEFHRVLTQEKRIPLIASTSPKLAVIRPETYFARKGSRELTRSYASLSSSVYSSCSRGMSTATVWTPHGTPTVDTNQTQSIKGDDEEQVDSIVIKPEVISQQTSFDSSVITPTED